MHQVIRIHVFTSHEDMHEDMHGRFRPRSICMSQTRVWIEATSSRMQSFDCEEEDIISPDVSDTSTVRYVIEASP